MTTAEIDYIDHEITVVEPEPTLLELVKEFGEERVRRNAIDKFRYHNKHPRVYAKTSQELEAFLPKNVKSEKVLPDGSKKKILESDIDHCRRCFAADPERTTETLTRHALSEPLFVEGKPGESSRYREQDLESANIFFAQGDDVVEDKVRTIEAMVPNYRVGRNFENAVTPESLARGITALNKHLVKQAQAQVKGALGS